MDINKFIDSLSKEERLALFMKLHVFTRNPIMQCNGCHIIDITKMDKDDCVIYVKGKTYISYCEMCENHYLKCCIEKFMYPESHYTENPDIAIKRVYPYGYIYYSPVCFNCLNIKM